MCSVLLTFSAILAVLFVPISGDSKDFQYLDCGGSLVHFYKLDFEPKPLVLSKTSKINLTIDADIDQDLPVSPDVKIIVEVNKTLHIGDEILNVTLPCIDGMGSCKYELCKIFDTWFKDLVDPLFKQNYRACNCPILAGKLASNNQQWSVPFEKIKGVIAHIASGDYAMRMTIENQKTFELLGCLVVEARLVEPEPEL